jgi:hypothetical protein
LLENAQKLLKKTNKSINNLYLLIYLLLIGVKKALHISAGL